MAVNNRSTWQDLMGLPTENEPYVTYFLTFKFIWAPIINLSSLIFNWVFESFTNNDNPISIIPLYTNPELATVAVQTIISAEEMVASYKKQKYLEDGYGNTELTSFIAGPVFSNYDINREAILEKIQTLSVLAKTDEHARQLLITPNCPGLISRENSQETGFPLNTPLMLMIKAGDVECVQLLLPFYLKDDLMTPTLRGNSVFHIAAITGQGEILDALEKHAETLNIQNVLIETKNHSHHTPEQILKALFMRDNCFKNFLVLCDKYLGGDEINKAACRRYELVHQYMCHGPRLLAH